jgi:hypothetical protein
MLMLSAVTILELVLLKLILLGKYILKLYIKHLITLFRTGKRTKQGAIQDGINSVIRYFKNNFFDGARQVIYILLYIENC